MEFPLSLTDSTRAEDARPVEFPLGLTDSTRAEDARPVQFLLRRTRALWSFPLSLTDSTRLRHTRDTRERFANASRTLRGRFADACGHFSNDRWSTIGPLDPNL